MKQVIFNLKRYEHFVLRAYSTVTITNHLPKHFHNLPLYWRGKPSGHLDHVDSHHFVMKITQFNPLLEEILQGKKLIVEKRLDLIGIKYIKYLELSSGHDLSDQARITLWR